MSSPIAILAVLGQAAGGLSGPRETSLITVLLVSALSFILILFLVGALMMVHFARASRQRRQSEMLKARLLPVERRTHPPVFAVPGRWLAVRNEDPRAVQAALGLLKPRPCSWEEGVSAAQDQKLFISPAVDGWILVMGSSLPEPAQDVDRCFHFIVALSRKLGAVQYFSWHRHSKRHAWVRADRGSIQRAYAWSGHTLWNEGRMTQAEADLRLKCYDYAEPAERSDFARADPVVHNTERVPLLAARWSVDPASIGARMPRATQGIAGELARSRTG